MADSADSTAVPGVEAPPASQIVDHVLERVVVLGAIMRAVVLMINDDDRDGCDTLTYEAEEIAKEVKDILNTNYALFCGMVAQ